MILRSALLLLALASLVTPVLAIPTISVKEIRPGMHGIVYTVLQGTTIVPVDTEILGVAENSLGPGYDLIIGKLVDPKTSLVEAVHGMSGSPLYIDGKLAGALSRRLATFEKDGHCGFTPIADMLRVAEGAKPPAAVAAVQGGPRNPFLPGKPAFLGGGLGNGGAFETLGIPFSVTGLSGAATQALLRAFGYADSGLVPVAAGGGESLARLKDVKLEPGSAVSAVLMDGALTVAGTGTLTWREGDKVLAFGHPMTGMGKSAWGMAPAEIITTIPSYERPYKLANVGPVTGTVVEDRLSAIAGIVGALPPMASYDIVRSFEGAPLPTLSGHFSVEPAVAPLLAASAAMGAVTLGNEAGRTLTLRATGEVEFQGLPPLRLGGVWSGEDVELAAALRELVAPLSVLYSQDWERPRPVALRLKLETSAAVHAWTVDAVRSDAPSYRPGATVGLDVTLRERYGQRVVRHVDLVLPPALKAGAFRVRVADGAALDGPELLRAVPALRDAAQLVALLNRRRDGGRLYVQVVSDAPGEIVADREMPALPPSVLSVMRAPGAGTGDDAAVALRERVWAETSQEIPGGIGALSGEQTLSLTIQP